MNTNKEINDNKSKVMTICRMAFSLIGVLCVIISMIIESEHIIWLVIGLMLINIATLINIRASKCCLWK